MIEIENVTKTYYTGSVAYQALKGVNFSVAAGEVVAIIGPSGCGKSTTMNILGLLDKPTTGRYLLNGKETMHLLGNQLAELRNREIGFIFQAFFLLPRLTALQNVGLPLFYARENPSVIKKRSMEMLEKVGMANFALHKPNELSGGQKQRVAIARALVTQPRIILADEPTGALDTKTSHKVLDLMIHQAQGTTVIIITHDPEIASHCPRVIEMRDGHVLKDTTKPDFVMKPKAETTE